MSGRISPVAPFGSLLKGAPKATRERKSKPKRKCDAKHLAAVRRCPCIACDTDPAGEVAHVRLVKRVGLSCEPIKDSDPVPRLDEPAIVVKLMPGIGRKPDDRWSLPLCHTCHMRQHAEGERPFWNALGLDPLAIAARLYAEAGTLSAMRAVIFKEREGRK